MSTKPFNILDLYRSYTYHHMLVMCDSTKTAEALAKREDITLFDEENIVSEERFSIASVPEQPDLQYIVLLNTAQSAIFTIPQVSWETMTTPVPDDESGEEQFRGTAVQGEMTIEEPQGARFMNVLAQASRDLGVDPMGITYLLKTIFFGHRDDGTSAKITNVKPLLFTLVDLSSSFDITGATYNVQFVGNVNGTSKLPQTSSVGRGFSFTIDKGSTLEQAIDKLQTRLNERYEQFKDTIQNDFICDDIDLDVDEDFANVRYVINLDESYRNYKAGTASKEQQEDSGDDDVVIVQKGNAQSIENLIEAVMDSSEQVLEESEDPNEGDSDEEGSNTKAQYKIETSFELTDEIAIPVSDQPGGNTGFRVEKLEEPEYVVTYNIHRYELQFEQDVADQAEDVNSSGFLSFEPPDGHKFELDYIFTGRNTSILDFQMKMEQGLAFFYTLASENNVLSGGQVRAGAESSNSTANDSSRQSQSEGVKRPLFLGHTLNDPYIRNQALPSQVQSFRDQMNRWAGISSLGIKMTIRGNPQLLSDAVPLPSDIRIMNNDEDGAEDLRILTTDEALSIEDEDAEPNHIIKRPWKHPAFVKVNIAFPSPDSDTFEPFWYRGWYYIVRVDQQFDRGEFKQELEMFSLPADVFDTSSLDGCIDVQTLNETLERLGIEDPDVGEQADSESDSDSGDIRTRGGIRGARDIDSDEAEANRQETVESFKSFFRSINQQSEKVYGEEGRTTAPLGQPRQIGDAGSDNN